MIHGNDSKKRFKKRKIFNQRKLIRKSLLNNTKPMLNLKARPKSITTCNNLPAENQAGNKRKKWILLAYSFDQYKKTTCKNRNMSLSVPKISQNLKSSVLEDRGTTKERSTQRNTTSRFNFQVRQRDRPKETDLKLQISRRKGNKSILKDLREQQNKLEKKINNVRSFTLSRLDRKKVENTPPKLTTKFPLVSIKKELEKRKESRCKTISTTKDEERIYTATTKLNSTGQVVSMIGSKLRVNLKNETPLHTSKNITFTNGFKKPKVKKSKRKTKSSSINVVSMPPKSVVLPSEPAIETPASDTGHKKQIIQRILTTDYSKNETKINLKNILNKYQKFKKANSKETPEIYRSKTMGRIQNPRDGRKDNDYRNFRDYIKY
ncbi:unnamed protein product [Moneuplotes crassus]|uniref:Uncharacterized protein n=1 Tax=Euplotes crassus TaxID=5936 RepID=A0AAD1U760_EUPCR|nr:unnamed protein product [Moneuplotes crassus]